MFRLRRRRGDLTGTLFILVLFALAFLILLDRAQPAIDELRIALDAI